MSNINDKVLQIASQLAYFNFADKNNNETESMIGFSLNEIFSKDNMYSYLEKEIYRTRKFDSNSGGSWESRKNATKDLMNYLRDPDGYDECKNTDNQNVDWDTISNWKVVAIKDLNEFTGLSSNGFYAVAFETEDNEIIVAFRGSESFDDFAFLTDWEIADFGLLNDELTSEQHSATSFMIE